jgi:tRNA threonylcarbamoyl adenosine modification protein (Sua5/YciO/YrdC/YwlC family)
MPTETVYGLAADALDPAAVNKIFAAKGRPADHPLIVHLPSAEHLPQWAAAIPKDALALARAFWPGPLTLILKRTPMSPMRSPAGRTPSACACPRIRSRSRCCAPSTAAWPRPAPTASAASARLPPRMCRKNSASAWR